MKKKLFAVGLISSGLFVLAIRLWIGLSRYFDPDEFAQMHWGYLMKEGLVPFRDFFFVYTAPFNLSFIPIIAIFGESSAALMAGRIYIFLLSSTTFILIYKIAKLIFGKKIAVLSFFLAASYPIALDKSIEFRPDNLMLPLFLVGFYLLLRVFSYCHCEQSSTHLQSLHLFLAGFFIGLSVVVLLKGVVFVAGTLPLVVFFGIKMAKGNWRLVAKTVLSFWLGGLFSVLLLITLYAYWGVLPQSYLFTFPINYQMFHAYSHFSPFEAFSNNWGIYGTYGQMSFEWIFNVLLWGASILGICVLFISSVRKGFLGVFEQAHKNNDKPFSFGGWVGLVLRSIASTNLFESFVLIFVPFAVCLIAIFYLFYLPYMQYFLILLPFISITAAYFLVWLSYGLAKLFKFVILGSEATPESGVEPGTALKRGSRNVGEITLVLVSSLTILLCLVSVFEAFYLRSKFSWRAFEDYKMLDFQMKISKPQDRFYDMAGSYVFRKDGYFECCVAFPDYIDKISYKMPDFISQMKERENKFVIRERNARLFGKLKKKELDFIEQNYVSTSEIGNVMVVGKVIDLTLGRVTFEIFVGGEYRVIRQTADGKNIDNGDVFIDGQKVLETVVLTKGGHIISSSLPRVTLMWNYKMQ